MFTDTHAHLSSGRFHGRLPEIIDRAAEAGVTRIITIGTDLEDSAENIRIAEEYPGVYATVGVHPTSVHEIGDPDWQRRLRDWLAHPKVVGLGEIGFDFYWPPRDGSSPEAWRALQEKFFREQLTLAAETEMPVVIHQRESAAATMEVMDEYAGRVRAVFHCWTSNAESAQHYLKQQHMISFTGIATYKNAPEVQDAASNLPLQAFMLETDAPYLAPVPHRGESCEPAFVKDTAAFIAKLRGISLNSIAVETSANADNFFAFERYIK